ncbi:MAG: ROK family protein [Lewinella sp.]|nr:ROK family protein [Lewinella sp.]
MENQENLVLGVDVGGSGIKGGLINIETGEMISERHRIKTPQPATTKAVTAAFGELVRHFDWHGPVGVGFPAILRDGKAYSAANIDKSWIGANVQVLFKNVSQCQVHALNDADAAGIAAMRYGIGKGKMGVVLLITIGSGIGSALFIDGKLVPNTEFGHIYMKGHKEVAEVYCSGNARKRENLEWPEWGKRFNEYLEYLDRTLSPSLIILGGGGSKHWDKYCDEITVDVRVKPAGLLNQAGAVGAAYYAWQQEQALLHGNS